mmetsp:Transcript_52537/g.87148  ORF Transcript_52537/g.87148 Transcript_52537/m.87148 type:complete len:481 (-) Transcript_52537:742-2184(-)
MAGGGDGKDELREALASVNLRQRKTSDEAEKHAFWDTQPVPALSDDTDYLSDVLMGPIDPPEPDKVRKQPYNLPDMFQWSDVNLDREEEAQQLYELLHENYVEDGDNMFRFDYSIPFLRWAMQPPGFRPQWHVGVRVTQTQKLVAFIGCTPAELYCHGQRVQPGPPPSSSAKDEADSSTSQSSTSPQETSENENESAVPPSDTPQGDAAVPCADRADVSSARDSVVEVNFLCVHKKLRSKRLAPVLIREITRRVNICGIFQACYTAGVVLPKPVARSRYYHRSLNPKKLIEVGFSRLAPRMTMVRTIKLYALPDAPQTRGLRPLKDSDCEVCCKLLNEHLKRYALAPRLSIDEFRHWLMPRTGVVHCYVVEDPSTKALTDMLSFYSLPSTILGNDKHRTLRAAYCYYYFTTKTTLLHLLTDALILAKRLDFDVFNALDILDNETVLKELKFGIGDGHLQYYMYNWRCATVKPSEVGLVLL